MKRFLVPTVLLLASITAYPQEQERIARQTRIAKQSATVNGDPGLFTVSSAETLNRGQYSITAGWLNEDRTPKDLDINSFPLSVSAGVAARIMITATFDVQRQVTASNRQQDAEVNSNYDPINSGNL